MLKERDTMLSSSRRVGQCVGLLTLLILISSGCAAGRAYTGTAGENREPPTDSSQQPGGISESKIREMAINAANTSGDPKPTSIRYVTASRRDVAAALDTLGSVLPKTEDDQVTLIVVEGTFVGTGLRLPPGQEPVRGTEIALTIDSTGQMTDFHLGEKPVDFTSLGELKSIPV